MTVNRDELKVVRTIQAPGASPQGLAWSKGRLAVADAKENTVFFIDAKTGKTIEKKQVPLIATGITYRDGTLTLVDDAARNLVHVDEKANLTGLTNLRLAKAEKVPLFKAENASVWGVAWDGKSYWVSCEAGYSSSIYQIQDGAVIKSLWAPGPKPRGLCYDAKSKTLLTVDARNLEVTRLGLDGKQVKTFGGLPCKNPTGLALDGEGYLWIADAAENKLYQVEVA